MIPETMDALVKAKAGPGLELKRVPAPVPGIGEVLLKIRKTAICGTDLHIYNWDAWSQKNIVPPITIGHEYIAEVAALGPNLHDHYTIGQRVSGEGHIVCNHCRNCRAGNGHWCKFTKGVGVNRDGAFAQYLCIPETNVIPIPDEIDDDVVSFFDAYGNATHTATMFDVIGEDVLITGAGPIGMMAAAICRQNGARRIVVTDVNDYRLELAKKMGASAAINTREETIDAAMQRLGIIEGFDVGLEMSGNASAIDQMIHFMRNGGKVALLGITSANELSVHWNEVIFKGLTMQGIYGRKMFETWYRMMAMIQSGLDLTPIITHRYPYTEFEKAFETMNSGRSGKIILDWQAQQ